MTSFYETLTEKQQKKVRAVKGFPLPYAVGAPDSPPLAPQKYDVARVVGKGTAASGGPVYRMSFVGFEDDEDMDYYFTPEYLAASVGLTRNAIAAQAADCEDWGVVDGI